MLTPEERQRIADEEKYRAELKAAAWRQLRNRWLKRLAAVLGFGVMIVVLFAWYVRSSQTIPEGTPVQAGGIVVELGKSGYSGRQWVRLEAEGGNEIKCYTSQMPRIGAKLLVNGKVAEWSDGSGSLNECKLTIVKAPRSMLDEALGIK